MAVDVQITTKGGLFSPANRTIVRDALRDMERTGAEAGAKIVRTHLDSVLRNPTGRYERSIGVKTTSRGADFTDGGVVYGPWLEGTSSRNTRSRFKGYAAFRWARQQLDRTIATVVQPDVNRLVSRLN